MLKIASKMGSTWIMAKKPRVMTDAALGLVARRFAGLAEPIRLRLLHALFDGVLSVGQLVDLSAGTQAKVSRHLQTLMDAGVLTRRKVGLQVFYGSGDKSIFTLCELVCGSLKQKHTQHAKSLAR